MKQYLSTLLIFFLSITATSQNLDSLWNIWNDETQADTMRLKAMNKIAWKGYLFSKPDSAFYFAQLHYDFAKSTNNKKWMAAALKTQGVSYAIRSDYSKAIDYFTRSLIIEEETGNKNGIASSLNNIGGIYIKQGNYSKAIDYFTRGLKIREQLGDKNGIASSLNNIGIIYYYKSNYAKSLDYYSRSLKINEELGDKKSIAGSLNSIGIIYSDQGDYIKAIDYYTKSLKIDEELGDDKIAISNCLNNLGTIYSDQGYYNKAVEYHTKSLKIKEEIGDKNGIASSLNNIGIIYKLQGDYAKAIDYQVRSLKIRKELGDKSGIASSLACIGNIYKDQGEYEKAIDYQNRSLIISEEIGNKSGISNSLNSIGYIYIKQTDYHIALEKCSKALSIAQEVGNVGYISDASNNLWKIYKKLGKHSKALEMYELYIQMRDSILSIENKEAMIHQEFKYKYEKEQALADAKHNELMHIKSEKIKTQNEKIEKEKAITYSLIIGMLIVISSLAVIFKNLRKTKQQKKLIETQHTKLNEAHKDLTSSITYAKRIQAALLPTDSAVKESFKESFILYLPKDIVAGDFYWLEKTKDITLFAVADCTGHGVPGAMVSVICNNALNKSVREHHITKPSKILDKTREIVIQEFAKSSENIQDGMDIALCSINRNKLSFAGANNPLILIRDNQVIKVKGDQQPIGSHITKEDFTSHSLEIEKDDMIYIFTDGFVDQFGGKKGKKYKLANLLTLLTSISTKALSEQNTILKQEFVSWKGTEDQIDDVCVMGIRV